MDIHKLKPILDRLMQTGDKWNFDLEDCDHILRVETRSISASTILAALENAGYWCEELEDILSLSVTVEGSIEIDQTRMGKTICGY